MNDPATLTSSTRLQPEEVAEVRRLVEAAALRDGFSALNEAALLHLRHPRAGVLHLRARRGPALAGYAQLDTESAPGSPQTSGTPEQVSASTPVSSPAPGPPTASTAQLVVHPEHRRAGVGSALLAELKHSSPAALRIWAMGDTSAARALAASQGLTAARTLLIMTRPLTDAIPEAPLPPDVSIRTFAVGADEEEWVAVNARAFRHHPEQGQLTRTDLEDRISEAWFDPAGFFLAIRQRTGEPPEVLGFHWTKQHPGQLGEVYVLGVDPTAGGGGLGRALLTRGLNHLRDRGNTSVQLYVEADHERAVALYTGYGFAESSRDVMYASS